VGSTTGAAVGVAAGAQAARIMEAMTTTAKTKESFFAIFFFLQQ
jgi:hypothetical protein